MDYETMRHFSDTWGLVFLVAVFVFVIGWIFRPGSSKIYEDQSQIPFHKEGEE